MWGIANRIRRHLADPESQHRKIAQGFLWVSLFVFLSKLAGAAKEMTIAWRYGVSETVDAYVFVFNLVSWPVSIWFGILTVVLVPLAARLRSESPSELPRFRAELLGLTLLLGLGLGALAGVAMPALLRSSWLGLAGSTVAKAISMTSGLALLVPLGFVVSLFSAWLLAAARHRNTLFEAIPAFVLMIFVLLPPGLVAEPLLWGTVAGFALHMTALASPLRRHRELELPAFTQRSPAWQGFWGSISIMALGQVLMSITSLVDQFFAAGLGPGALSTLSYANRILGLVLGLGATTIARATLPVFSEAQTGCSLQANHLALYWAKLVLTFGFFILAASWFVAPWVVVLLFERGAFVPENTGAVTTALRYGLFQVPFYAFALTMASHIASQKKYYILLVSGGIGLIAKFMGGMVLIEHMQLNGLMLSGAVVYLATGIFFYIYIRHKEKNERAEQTNRTGR